MLADETIIFLQIQGMIARMEVEWAELEQLVAQALSSVWGRRCDFVVPYVFKHNSSVFILSRGFDETSQLFKFCNICVI